MELDLETLDSLEYKGEYGARYTCRDCSRFVIKNGYGDYRFCSVQGIDVYYNNNVCRYFDAKIKNPTSPAFNFDDYLEFLGSDYYRPWGITNEIIGSAKLGEAVPDGGRLARLMPEVYSPLYRDYSKPYCSVRFPRCHVKIDNHLFEIDYRRYREVRTIEDGKVHFDLHLWKDSPKQRKYRKETFGTFEIESKGEKSE